MNKVKHEYYNLVAQGTRATGTIHNSTKGLEVIIEDKNSFITKEEFVDNYLEGFRSSYAPFPTDKKVYKDYLKKEIKYTADLLEQLKFAYNITGRRILDKE